MADRSRILSMFPGQPTPDWVPVAGSIGELADKIGIERAALERTVEEVNAHAENGQDPDYRRTELGLMAPGAVRPLDRAPYYAVVIWPGALGTNGGPRLDVDGRVRGHRTTVIDGLYAAGNTAASAYAWAYPGGGATIANGMVFGFRAGRHLAAQPSRDV